MAKIKKQFFNIVNKSEDEAEIYIYEIIGEGWFGDGMSSKRFMAKLKALGDVKKITLHIDSDGGSVFDGFTIYNLLKRHEANVTVYIDGVAASIASVIAMAGDTIYMPKNALLMIHNPVGAVMGEVKDMEKMIEILNKVKEGIMSAYTDKSGMDDKTLSEMMDSETWFTAREAKDAGLIDVVEGEAKVAACHYRDVFAVNDREINIAQFNNFPKEHFDEAEPVKGCAGEGDTPDDDDTTGENNHVTALAEKKNILNNMELTLQVN